ncbi:DNA-methyltransferase [Spiroplasma endosymbiont of Ammophila pubescens]|uniref:DNA-methyltransferase n=1 Tax=Spiroplasma endosymbiont of Ammophila pubescens TaxID=3066315 RepID=UPI0032B24FF2
MKTNLGELIHGDSLEILKTIPNKSIDLILTDPPYFYESIRKKQNKLNVKKDNSVGKYIVKNALGLVSIKSTKHIEYEKYLNEFKRITKFMNCLIWLNIEQIYQYLPIICKNKWRWYLLKWIKTNPIPRNNPYYKDTEYCLWIFETGAKYTKTYENCKTVYYYPIGKDENINHPTVKPIEMIKEQLFKHSQPGDTVLDCFLGSGTTAIACEQLNRRWIGIEINEKYYKLAKQRLSSIQTTLFI